MIHALRRLFVLVPFATLLATPAVAQTRFETLVRKETRPTVTEVESLLREQSITQAPDGSHLPKVEDKPEHQMQNNFALWSDEIKKRAAHMIVTFEKNLPGVNYVFVGRDMAIIADLFEAFYRSIGQPDRVIRVGMSSGTVPSLSEANGVDQTVRFLESSGLKVQTTPDHPYFFVDAISRGGGRQIRFLLKNIYAKLVNEQRADLARTVLNYNAVGLSVFTTNDSFADLANAERYFDGLDRSAADAGQRSTVMDAQFNLMVYRDGRAAKSFLGINEAGYTHWTGAWHESYGPLREENGALLATPGVLATDEVRTALLKFQAVIVGFAESEQLKNQVVAEATRQGFSFPMHRPVSLLNFASEARKQLEEAKTFDERLRVYHELANAAVTSSKQQSAAAILLRTVRNDPHRTFDQVTKIAKLVQLPDDFASLVLTEELGKATTWDAFEQTLGHLREFFREHRITASTTDSPIFKLALSQLPFEEGSYARLLALAREIPPAPEDWDRVVLREVANAKSLAELKSLNESANEIIRRYNLKLETGDDFAAPVLRLFGAQPEARAFVKTLALKKQRTFEALLAASPGEERFELLKSRNAKSLMDANSFSALLQQHWVAIETGLIAMTQKNSERSVHAQLREDLGLLLGKVTDSARRRSLFQRALVTSNSAEEFVSWFAQNRVMTAAELGEFAKGQLARFFALKPTPQQTNLFMRMVPEHAKVIVVEAIRQSASLEDANALENRGNMLTQPEEVKTAMKELKERLSSGSGSSSGGKAWMFWKSAQIRCEGVF